MTSISALPVAQKSIDDGGGTIELHIPSGHYLTAVSVGVNDNCPRVSVRVSLHPVSTTAPTIQLIPLGTVWRSVGQNHTAIWIGKLWIGDDYQYKISVTIQNLTGTSKEFGVVAYVE